MDYAILDEGKAVLLIEAKAAHRSLDDKPTPQLRRYAIDGRETLCVALTNGSVWNWYKKSEGRLDDRPFLKTNVLEPHENDLSWLAAVRGGRFNRSTMDAAEDQEMVDSAAIWLKKSAQKPNDSLLRLVLRETGRAATKSNIARMNAIWARAWQRSVETPKLPARESTPLPAPPPENVISPVRSKDTEAARNSRTCRYRIVGSTKWRELKNATYLLGEIVAYCADRHAQGRAAYLKLLSRDELGKFRRPLLVFSGQPNLWQSANRKHYSIDFGGYHLFNHIGNKGKMAIIDRYLARCMPSVGTPPKRGVDIEVEMPNVT